MLDRDLVVVYGVETKCLNEQVKRTLSVFQMISCSNLPKKSLKNGSRNLRLPNLSLWEQGNQRPSNAVHTIFMPFDGTW